MDVLEELYEESRLETIERKLRFSKLANHLNTKLGFKKSILNITEWISNGENSKIKHWFKS